MDATEDPPTLNHYECGLSNDGDWAMMVTGKCLRILRKRGTGTGLDQRLQRLFGYPAELEHSLCDLGDQRRASREWTTWPLVHG